MASATGITDVAVTGESVSTEDEPLLGRAGDASQHEGVSLCYNLVIGTAVIAQAGIVLLVASVWASIFLHDLILFSAHPLLNSASLLFLTQGILILQPTHTSTQKRKGTIAHFILNNLGLDLLVAGLVVIEYNKIRGGTHHFESVHGILGLITYIFLAIQALVGFTAYFVPKIYGGESKAKALYKWHRLSGYVLLVLLLATVLAATQTTYIKNVIHIKFWAIFISGILVLIGVLPRIKKQKLGLGPYPSSAFGQ